MLTGWVSIWGFTEMLPVMCGPQVGAPYVRTSIIVIVNLIFFFFS